MVVGIVSRDPYHAPSFTDEAATVLPVGTPVYAVIIDSRLARRLDP